LACSTTLYGTVIEWTPERHAFFERLSASINLVANELLKLKQRDGAKMSTILDLIDSGKLLGRQPSDLVISIEKT
jgi:hypothetical protein